MIANFLFSLRDKYNTSILFSGVEFGARMITIDGKQIKLQIWDTAGTDIFLFCFLDGCSSTAEAFCDLSFLSIDLSERDILSVKIFLTYLHCVFLYCISVYNFFGARSIASAYDIKSSVAAWGRECRRPRALTRVKSNLFGT